MNRFKSQGGCCNIGGGYNDAAGLLFLLLSVEF
ncbi:Uncharacterised protein [Bartonella grahamii]|uniref:Uncharacterized protein n=1 Tax=Bartonella grahamii TaxID=33045 RepID=A0A336NB73_BARGR|nr:Uncharacterised protein [Bartonella grahamii]